MTGCGKEHRAIDPMRTTNFDPTLEFLQHRTITSTHCDKFSSKFCLSTY